MIIIVNLFPAKTAFRPKRKLLLDSTTHIVSCGYWSSLKVNFFGGVFIRFLRTTSGGSSRAERLGYWLSDGDSFCDGLFFRKICHAHW